MQWQLFSNPSNLPKPSSGYAYEYEGNDYDSFESVGNEEWEISVIGTEEMQKARYVGRSMIDDSAVAVWEVEPEAGFDRRWIAQQVFA